MTRIAFIAHTATPGGAAISATTNIQYLVDKGLLDLKDCLLIFPAGESGKPIHEGYLRLRFKINSYTWHLPFSLVYRGCVNKISSKIYRVAMTMWSMLMFSNKYNRILIDEKIDVVHLNSITLWPLLLVLPKNIRKVIHIREDQNDSFESDIADRVIKKCADAIIAIEEPIRRQYRGCEGVLTSIRNPFDMCTVRYMKPFQNDLKTDMKIPGKFVVSMFGPVGKQKGTDFLISLAESMKKVNTDIVFMVVGVPEDKNGNYLCKMFVNDVSTGGNIMYVGNPASIDELYAATDVVIRCEDYLPMGRTVWEGVYSGTISLIPIGKRESATFLGEYLGKYIYTYPAGDVIGCRKEILKIMENRPKLKVDSGFPECCNVEQSAKQMLSILTVKLP